MAQVIRRIVSFPPICTHSLLSRALSTLADGAGADAAASASAQVPAESRSYQTAATAPAADPELPSGHELDAALEHAFASTIAHNAATRRAADASIGQSTLGALLAQTQRPISSASTLHRELYTSEEAFQLENTRLFERAWYCVGHISQVARPGGVRVSRARERRLAAAHAPRRAPVAPYPCAPPPRAVAQTRSPRASARSPSS